MNRYFLFFGLRYYPNGGWGDFVASYATADDAEKEATERANKMDKYAEPWWEIVDSLTLAVERKWINDDDA